jgi:DNA-binding HxlR family transcriptional regulator
MEVSNQLTAGRPLPPADVLDPNCPSRGVLDHIMSRWGVLVFEALRERPYRFNELRRRIGVVSEKMLSQTLQTLERDGFVLRDAHPVIPPRVDYSLTPLGREVADLIDALAVWVEKHVPEVLDARDQHDARSVG